MKNLMLIVAFIVVGFAGFVVGTTYNHSEVVVSDSVQAETMTVAYKVDKVMYDGSYVAYPVDDMGEDQRVFIDGRDIDRVLVSGEVVRVTFDSVGDIVRIE